MHCCGQLELPFSPRHHPLQAADLRLPSLALLSRHEVVEDGLNAGDAVVQALAYVGAQVLLICTQR